jgi:hypothetical protein
MSIIPTHEGKKKKKETSRSWLLQKRTFKDQNIR